MSTPNFNLQLWPYIADSMKVALGIWNSTLGGYCLLVTQANHCCSDFHMPKYSIAKATSTELALHIIYR